MGAGRKTQTIPVSDWPSKSPSGSNFPSARNLSKSDLGGAIFGCKHSTMTECLVKKLFGLPSSHFSYVRNIKPGLPLFLFNYSDRKMHGIYEAASSGEMNIDPYAWTDDGKQKTKFPAQVRVQISIPCKPIPENQFKKTIGDNYYKSQHFWFELDHDQTSSLIALFTASPLPMDSILSPIASLKVSHLAASPSTKTIANSENEYRRLGEQMSASKLHVKSADDFPSPDRGNEDTGGRGFSKTSRCFHEQWKFKETMSGGDDWVEENFPEGHSGVSLIQDRESKSLSEQRSGSEKLEIRELGTATKMMKHLSFGPEYPFSSEICEDIASIELSAGEVQEETVLAGKSSIIVEEENINISNPYHGNSECMNIINELKEKATALEKRQMESVLEMQQMRYEVKDAGLRIQQLETRIKELESKLILLMGPENIIYLIGGYNGDLCLSTFDCFSPSVDLLKPLKSMNSPRSYASAAALHGNLYVFGGGDGNSWCNTVECYNQMNDEWILCSPLIRAKGSLAGAALNDKIFAVGGGNGSECFSDVEMFDPVLDRWIYYQSMLHKRFAPTAVELHGVLYAVGGFDGRDYLQSVERLDPRVGYWETLPDMKFRKGCHSTAVLNEKLFVMGGHDGKGMLSSFEIFDPRLGSWMEGEPLNHARGYAAAAVLGDSLFVMGGVNSSNDIVEMVECYKEGVGWTHCNFKAIGKRCFFSAIVP